MKFQRDKNFSFQKIDGCDDLSAARFFQLSTTNLRGGHSLKTTKLTHRYLQILTEDSLKEALKGLWLRYGILNANVNLASLAACGVINFCFIIKFLILVFPEII